MLSSIPQLLIVDDDPATLEALPDTLQLRLPRVEIETSDRAEIALHRLASKDYSVVISDLKMPGMDGLALLDHAKHIRPETPVLLMTGHGDADFMLKAFEEGAYDFISKPFDRTDLIVSVTRAIDTHRLRRLVKEHETAYERYGALLTTLERRLPELRHALVELPTDSHVYRMEETRRRIQRSLTLYETYLEQIRQCHDRKAQLLTWGHG